VQAREAADVELEEEDAALARALSRSVSRRRSRPR
jgi:hypothetical protein